MQPVNPPPPPAARAIRPAYGTAKGNDDRRPAPPGAMGQARAARAPAPTARGTRDPPGLRHGEGQRRPPSSTTGGHGMGP
ncbi:hypothetical protein GCM10022285_30340 [Streptomyces tunisiensis]|uniref:Uncharacterized protein n=1 Tax=Streptomyces tunisiensis TaxID=948699 RepID=A0ABP7YGW3_9ACTN